MANWYVINMAFHFSFQDGAKQELSVSGTISLVSIVFEREATN